MKRRNVPEGWFDYSRFGNPIDSTRIVAVKTPLKKYFNTGRPAEQSGDYARILHGVPIEEEFTPGQMVELFKGREWIVGLVIDLTYTHRYYDPQEFIHHGVQHIKIKCPGQIIPPDDIYHRLSSELSDFLSDPANDDKLVAVHCTHGLNRTGYLVCRYLMEKCGYDADDAIKAFNRGRGSDIERENYLQHLRNGCPKQESSSRQSKSPEKNNRAPITTSVPPDGSPTTLSSETGCSRRRGRGGGSPRPGGSDWVEEKNGSVCSWEAGDLREKLRHSRAAADSREDYCHHDEQGQDYRYGGGRRRRRRAETGDWRQEKRARYDDNRNDYYWQDGDYNTFERGGGRGGGERGHLDSWDYRSHDSHYYDSHTPHYHLSAPWPSHPHSYANYAGEPDPYYEHYHRRGSYDSHYRDFRGSQEYHRVSDHHTQSGGHREWDHNKKRRKR